MATNQETPIVRLLGESSTVGVPSKSHSFATAIQAPLMILGGDENLYVPIPLTEVLLLDSPTPGYLYIRATRIASCM